MARKPGKLGAKFAGLGINVKALRPGATRPKKRDSSATDPYEETISAQLAKPVARNKRRPRRKTRLTNFDASDMKESELQVPEQIVTTPPPRDQPHEGISPTLGLDANEELSYYICRSCKKYPFDPDSVYELECGHGVLCKQHKEFKCKEEVDCSSQGVDPAGKKLKNKVKAIRVKCGRFDEGCEWEDVLENWGDHFERGCRYQFEICSCCGDQYRLVNKQEHFEICKRFECALMKCGVMCGNGKMDRNELSRHREEKVLEHIDLLAEEVAQVKQGCQEEVVEVAEVKDGEVVTDERNDSEELIKLMQDMNRLNVRVIGLEYVLGVVDDVCG